MGECAICGETFIKEVLMDLLDTGQDNIMPFNVTFVQDTLYAHHPDCSTIIKEAFDTMKKPTEFRRDMIHLHSKLPEGPLKKALTKAMDEAET